MSSSFRVQVSKDYLVFASAHFITFRGHQCETLHGHNYRVAVEIRGTLDEDSLVVDFIAVRDSLREIVAQLDHVFAEVGF